MKTIGLIVNPVAGMGGAVGLKGTDGDMYEKAIDLGAQPVAPDQAREFLSHIRRKDQIRFLAAPGQMGAEIMRGLNLPHEVAGDLPGERSTAADTVRIAKEMAEAGADLIVFVGGDGTARDLYNAVGAEMPVIAVPAGVKIFSGVFAVSARGVRVAGCLFG
ncbi:MAG: NAD(+)/NADH kinase [Anaerolineaceae bacterium]